MKIELELELDFLEDQVVQSHESVVGSQVFTTAWETCCLHQCPRIGMHPPYFAVLLQLPRSPSHPISPGETANAGWSWWS